MTRYADPTRCPDCGAALAPGAPTCRSCALPLLGETAQRLFATFVLADELLAALRATAAVPAAGPASSPRAPGSSAAVALPAAALPAARRRRARLSGASVPQVLLALGAVCLLVAALVFLVVSWSGLGVTGRTVTLVGFTTVAGVLAAWLARHGLRAATESLALVGYGLLALDLVGADNAGWFGDLSGPGLQQLLGAVLVGAGLAGALAVRRAPVAALTSAEVVAALGAALVAVGLGAGDALPVAPSLVVATGLAAALTVSARRLRLPVCAAGSAVVTAGSWLSLAAVGLERALDHPHWSALWLHLEGWPLLAAAGLVGAVALLHLPTVQRVAAASVAHLVLAAALLVPALELSPTPLLAVALAVLVLAGVQAVLTPRPWGLVAVLTQSVASVGVLTVAALEAAEALARLHDVSLPAWTGAAGDRFPAWLDASDQPAAWLLPLVVLALAGTLWTLARTTPGLLAGQSEDAFRVVAKVALPLVVALTAAAGVAALALSTAPVWLVVGALLAGAAGLTAWWLRDGSTVSLGGAGLFLTGAVTVSLNAELLSAASLTLAVAATAAVHLRSRSIIVGAVAGALVAGALAGATWSWGATLDGAPVWGALTGLLLLGATVLLAPSTPGRWWASDRPSVVRTGLELGAGAAALALASAGVDGAETGRELVWTALYLTVAGALVTVMSLLRPDRRVLAWVGGTLLALASWVRLWDLGVSTPEAYTLPAATVLVLVGLDRMRRDPALSTMAALAPGLSVALVPSLLWVLAEPTGLRPLLLGLGCLLLVGVAARLGWTAPLALGASTGALLVLRLAAPYVEGAVPRWVLIAVAGAALIAVGATWERRLADARTWAGYVRELR